MTSTANFCHTDVTTYILYIQEQTDVHPYNGPICSTFPPLLLLAFARSAFHNEISKHLYTTKKRSNEYDNVRSRHKPP